MTDENRTRRASYLPFALPGIGEEEIAEVVDTMRSGWLTTGPKTALFEQEFAAYFGVEQAVAVNSCTAAMHLALDAIGLQPGDEVITTPYTFAASSEVICYFGAKPVFVDIRPEDFNIDPARIEGAIGERTRAILPVHVGGLSADLDPIYTIAKKHGLAVVEDAAHSIPTRYKGRLIGSAPIPPETGQPYDVRWFGCFSFYATKALTTGEGGMITTNDAELADHCRVMRLHGISKDAWKRYTAEGSWYYEIAAPGYKYNMTDIAAAMGRVQLRRAAQMRDRRAEIARRYTEAFSALPELQPPSSGDEGHHAWHLYMLRLNLDRLTIDRAAFIEQMKTANIGTSVHFIPFHLHPYYRDTYHYQPEDFPVAYREYQREVSLPIFSRMTDQDINDVIGVVSDIVERHQH
ncbi:MAG: DegT/DnrJ/EryC1/StrS family aminotransferase [Anaerolineae bacterium]|nr:DegT/DnrJ/EryC1/StrS family aminotransferase [Anaerolineae bacterium]